MNYNMEIISMEEYPLRRSSCVLKRPPPGRTWSGPLRVVRLCVLSILLPGALIAGPLYIRYHLYSDQIYPLAMSDMRLIDNRVSTTWCQKQHIRVNTTFNAFLLPDVPVLVREPKPLTMVRELKLLDDMKEYWGFYLLKGSSVTVSTCTRWPGSSLTIIRGHKHLHECAYIGDDSSEEIDELMQAIREGTYRAPDLDQKQPSSGAPPKNPKTTNPEQADSKVEKNTSAPGNSPRNMKRHRADVRFHDPTHANRTNSNQTLTRSDDEAGDEPDEIDKKQMVSLLAQLSQKTAKVKPKTWDDHIHKHRNQSVNASEQRNLRFAEEAKHRKEVQVLTSEEIFQKTLILMRERGDYGKRILERLIEKYNLDNATNGKNQTAELMKLFDKALGKDKTKSEPEHISTTPMMPEITTPPVQVDQINATRNETAEQLRRAKRAVVLALAKNLNENDEDKDGAFEEDLIPDGIADHHETINETTLNDRSNSEFWSSFSSSEEALLNCAGLILNLPLTPHMSCAPEKSNQEALGAGSLPNTVTYIVPTNGYYFFVFNSENEVQENYLRIQFDLLKTLYNVTNSVASCFNSTTECALSLQFFSNEKLVLELPVSSNDSLWNQEFVVVSECEPRTSIYVVCVIAVPLVILLFAFQ